MGMKVAIVGMSPTYIEAPFDDPTWQKWGLPWGYEWARMDRLFEMHSLPFIKQGKDSKGNVMPANHMERLQECGPVYMQEAYPEIPESIAYPLEEVGKSVAPYWSSSVGYMLALAIHEGAEEIGLYGVDMQGDHASQRPNAEYLLAIAKERGIKITLPNSCPLLKYQDDDFNERYGWLG
jgi:hypothetical protein